MLIHPSALSALARRALRILPFLLLAFLPAAHAQVLTGQIDGIVRDATGAVIPNATVIITNSDENLVKRTVKTDAQGQFTAPLLSIGTYSLRIEASNFKTETLTGLEVHVGQPTAAPPIALTTGEVSETVTVSTTNVGAQLDSPASSTLVDSEQVTQLSLSSRDYLQLLYIQPGVSGGIPGRDDRGNITTSGQVNTQTFSVNGNGTAANGYFVDGADTLKRAGQQPVAFPGVDFIQEINLQRAQYGAEYGGAGAAFISVQTKTGGSKFHGGVFGFFRSQIFDADPFFNRLSNVPIGGERYADFGYNVGGPVLIPGFNRGQAKTFFFFGQEYLRTANTLSTTITNLSTAAQRQGIFAAPVCVLATACTAATKNTTTSITTVDPTAQAYLKDIINKLPVPNSPTDPQGYTYNAVGFNNESQTLIRIDHQFTDKFSVFFRYLDDPFNLVVPQGFQATSAIPGVATSRMTDGSTNYLGHFTYVFRGIHVVEGGYSYRANWVTAQPIGYLEASNSPDIAVQLPYPSTLGQVPHININGSNFAVTGPYNERGPLQQIFLNNTNSLGRHTLKLGLNVEFETGGSTAASANAGTFTFSPGTLPTGGATQFTQAFAYFLTGQVTTFTQTATDVAGTNHTNIYEGYVQDDFHANNRLTLTAGLRYSYFASATTADLAGHPQLPVLNFNPASYVPGNAPTLTPTGIICTVAPCTGGKLPNPNYNPTNGIIIGNLNSPFGADVQTTPNKDFAPRLGFTYDVDGKGRMALRGGFGLYYYSVTGNQAKFATSQDPPNVTNVTINNTTFGAPSGGAGVIPPASPGVLQALQVHDPAPYSEQYSLDFQAEVRHGLTLDIGYYGNHGVHVFGNIDINQAPAGAFATAGVTCTAPPCATPPVVTTGNTPDLNILRPYVGYSAITTQSDIFSSNYNSLQSVLRQRLRNGTIFTATYTWARGLTNARTPQNSANLSAEYGPDGQMRTHVFNSSFVYPFPFYRTQQGFLGHILGGFQTSGIVSVGSGQYITALTTGVDPAGVGLLVGPAAPRPDAVGNPNVGGLKTQANWFNKAAFANVPAGQYRPGNAPIGDILAPGYQNWDLSIFRTFRIIRETNLQLRLETFNTFNHVNFAGIGNTITATNYGQITSAGQNRTLQLGGKFTF